MGLAPTPTTVIVSASGELPHDHAGLRDPRIPVAIATTNQGARRLAGLDLGSHVNVVRARPSGAFRGQDVVAVGTSLGARVILTEGGPRLMGTLLGDASLDELFLTLAPQLVGRGKPERLGLVEGLAFAPADAAWHDLLSVRRSDSHLFLRYRLRREPTIDEET
jgi:riboflavin biosynthesis pyrimidine reductase